MIEIGRKYVKGDSVESEVEEDGEIEKYNYDVVDDIRDTDKSLINILCFSCTKYIKDHRGRKIY